MHHQLRRVFLSKYK
ncbi:unnamed protein product [Cuscuta europaea]|uniref:Uncharacterized protein n=1 Tax=Cuscuta europaea TaxID=41803 RepID=A0A9P0Z8B6_CUSEU|nr:unnamed protein product [Cuscuta europaea]